MSLPNLDSIYYYSKDGITVAKENHWLTSNQGNRVQRKTTTGWKILFKWKDGSKSWIPLKLAKESNPIEVAEFFTSISIADEPAFSWWVMYVLRKRDRIISFINSRVKKATHKFGIEIPTSYADFKRLDK